MGRSERSEKIVEKKLGETQDAKCGSRDGRRSPTSPTNVATPARGGRSRESATSGSDKARGPTSALEDLMRRKGVDEAWCALEEMQQQGVTTDKYTVSRMLMKTVGDGRTRLNPSRVYRGISLVERFIEMQPKDVDEVLFNALLDTCCRLKDLNRLEATVNRMRELKVSPSPVTLGILVKTYGQAGDLQKVIQVWSEMEKQRGQANAVTYGCMIDACVKCGHLEKAVEIFRGMRKVGKHRNTILYTTLIKGYGLEKDLANALELFREMPGEGVPYNTITYNSILDACIKFGDLATAEGLLREMTAPESSLEPDLITFSTLLKGYCHVGDLDKALRTAEAIKARGLRCDELVYNTLMDGCVKANDITAGVGLFEEMVQNGMRPSAITHSILARLYQRAGYEDDASEAVAQLYQHHGIERPNGGDRSKSFGRRRNPRSPSGRGSERGSPLDSPSAVSTTSGLGIHRERGDSAISDNGWGTPWGSISAMPGFEPASAEPSAPSTPLASPASSIHSGGYLSIDPMRGSYGMPLPHMGGNETPYSPASCTPAGSMAPASFAGSVAGSPCVDGSPCGMLPSFNMPASPQPLQPGFGPVGTPVQVQGAASQLPVWPFAGGSPFAGLAAPQPPLGTMPGGEGPSPSPAPPPPVASPFSTVGGGAPGSGEALPAMLQTHQTPFPMPLSPPHDLSYGAAMGQQGANMQAYFENWVCGGQQVGSGMHMGNNVPMGSTNGNMQMNNGGSQNGHGQFFS